VAIELLDGLVLRLSLRTAEEVEHLIDDEDERPTGKRGLSPL
jgi:hypothetical protein